MYVHVFALNSRMYTFMRERLLLNCVHIWHCIFFWQLVSFLRHSECITENDKKKRFTEAYTVKMAHSTTSEGTREVGRGKVARASDIFFTMQAYTWSISRYPTPYYVCMVRMCIPLLFHPALHMCLLYILWSLYPTLGVDHRPGKCTRACRVHFYIIIKLWHATCSGTVCWGLYNSYGTCTCIYSYRPQRVNVVHIWALVYIHVCTTCIWEKFLYGSLL